MTSWRTGTRSSRSTSGPSCASRSCSPMWRPSYESYRFNSVYRALYDYVNDISAVYMDVTKDRLYAEAPASPRRRAVQTVLMNILEVLVRVMAPILSFTTDEVWECYPPAFRAIEGREASVQLAGWPCRARLRAFSACRCGRASGDHGGDDGRPRGGHQGAGGGAKREDHRQEPGGVAYRDGPGGAGGHGRLLRPGGLRGAVHCGQGAVRGRRRRRDHGGGHGGRGREVPALLEHSRAGRQPEPSGRVRALRGRAGRHSRAGPSKWPPPRR